MGSMDRRSFLGAMGALGVLTATGSVAIADEAETAGDARAQEIAFAEEQAAMGPLTEDPERLCERGGTTLTVEELNKIRRERVEAAGDLELEDGTVVPAIWHKLDVLMDTYGCGGPDPMQGEGIPYLQYLYNNDEQAAEHYLEMPWGKIFTAGEYAEKSGRTIDECTAICDDMAQRGLLFRARKGDSVIYHHVAYVHGLFEQAIPRNYEPEYIELVYPNFLFAPTFGGLVPAGAPAYYTVPCGEEIVADERILPLNDYREVIERHEVIALMPCVCSIRENMRLGVEVPPIGSEELEDFVNAYGHGHHLERCLSFGEEAEYYLSIGAGRQISKEEAYAIMERNIGEGLVTQLGYTRNSEFICSCHSDCCGTLGSYLLTDPEVWENSPLKHNQSNYLLQYDQDICLQCGACAQRCPMGAISMDNGYPEVNTYCVRCGQCGMVCPVSARKLTARPANDCLPVPDNHMDDHNRKFGYRIQHGLA